jgi:dTDP-3-amino-3,4,6-trideoxy-alpha-D-glucose transaminase
VVTDDGRLASRVRALRNYGQEAKNEYAMLGYNSRLDSLQATILTIKLRRLWGWNQRRRAIAAVYRQMLDATNLVLPCERLGTSHVYHLFVVQHDDRDALLARLGAAGVQCAIHYPTPVHKTQPFRSARTVPEGAPVASRLARRILSLPMFPHLSDEMVRQVAQSVSVALIGCRLAEAENYVGS